MVSLTLHKPDTSHEGIRPIDLRSDLAPLADLIELVFADSMDSSGRAAIREMRALSRFGMGLNVLAGMGDLKQGLGYVWTTGGRLVGNVSIYPSHLPLWMGRTWLIANVAVHPDYRGRGIARQLMETSLRSIREAARGRTAVALLQVEHENYPARRLYDSLGFVSERVWTTWRRPSSYRASMPTIEPSPYITRRRRGEWRAEFALAQKVRPASGGGIGWLRPLHAGLFRPSLGKLIDNLTNLRSVEHLVIRAEQPPNSWGNPPILGSLWIDSTFGLSAVQLTLMVDPEYAGLYDHALINLAVRRFGAREALTIEHPADEPETEAVLIRNGFIKERTLLHMRWQSNQL